MELTEAYVMIKFRAGDEKNVLLLRNKVAEIDGVTKVKAVLGTYDIIAEVSVPSEDKLQETVLYAMRRMAGIESTNTLIVVED